MTERFRRGRSRCFLVATAAAMFAALTVPALASAQARLSLVKDINPGTEGCDPIYFCPGSAPRNLTTFHGALFFSADDGVHGRELWKSDGTRAGTKLVKAFGRDDPSWFTKGPGGRLFFFADEELWRSDGTRSGTKLVKKLTYGPFSFSDNEVTKAGRLLFFTTRFSDHFWRSDGTREGTRRIKRVRSPRDLTNVGGTLFFKALDRDRAHGHELWRSDGTRAGTKLAKDINPGTESGSIGRLQAFFGKLFFRADDGVHGEELWKSNGTSAGTRLFKEIEPGSAGSYPHELRRVRRKLIFFVGGGGDPNTCQLWKSDGTRSGTKFVTGEPGCPWEPTKVAGTLFFVGDDGWLWRSDGTRSGTKRVVEDLEGQVEDPRSFTGAGGILFFAGGYGRPGDELWKVVP